MKVQTMSLQDQDVSNTQQADLSAAAVLGIDPSTMDHHQKMAIGICRCVLSQQIRSWKN